MMMPPIDPINILAKNAGIDAIFFNKMSPVQYIHRSEKLGLWHQDHDSVEDIVGFNET